MQLGDIFRIFYKIKKSSAPVYLKYPQCLRNLTYFHIRSFITISDISSIISNVVHLFGQTGCSIAKKRPCLNSAVRSFHTSEFRDYLISCFLLQKQLFYSCFFIIVKTNICESHIYKKHYFKLNCKEIDTGKFKLHKRRPVDDCTVANTCLRLCDSTVSSTTVDKRND